MFKNCGGKLKAFAYVEMVLTTIASVIVEIRAMGIAGDVGDGTELICFMYMFFGLCILIGGYIGALVLYTIGDIWEQATLFGFQPFEKQVSSGSSANSGTARTVSASGQDSPTPQNAWECSCGHTNSDLKTACSRCGKVRE